MKQESQVKSGLIVRELVKTYSGRSVVSGLSLEVRPGEIVGLLGPNGAGKTTAFYMIIGLIKAESGDVLFNDVNITNMPIHKRARLGLGYLAQEPSVFKDLTVEENLLCILEASPFTANERAARLKELLAELNLTPLAKKKAASLSGGERRRLEITRALVTNPTCLMLDEPFANIDPIAIQEVKNIVKLLSQKGIGILITDHNAREIFSVVNRSYLVAEGKAILSGTVQELVSNEYARHHYFGENFKL
jgi:lipopolysaccharide export system ATP-binding protein